MSEKAGCGLSDKIVAFIKAEQSEALVAQNCWYASVVAYGISKNYFICGHFGFMFNFSLDHISGTTGYCDLQMYKLRPKVRSDMVMVSTPLPHVLMTKTLLQFCLQSKISSDLLGSFFPQFLEPRLLRVPLRRAAGCLSSFQWWASLCEVVPSVAGFSIVECFSGDSVSVGWLVDAADHIRLILWMLRRRILRRYI